MAVRHEAVGASAAIINFPFPKGTRPETARLLLDAQRYGIMEQINPKDRIMLDRYFGTPATLSDIGIAGSISDCEAQVRLRKGLVRLMNLLPDEVRERHSRQATFLKTRRPGQKRNLAVTQAPFLIEVRHRSRGKDQVNKNDLDRDLEKPLMFFRPSEYLLRVYKPPDISSQDSGEDLKPMSKRILSLLGRGLTYDEIATVIRKGNATVRHFLARETLHPAINASNTHEALVVAMQKGHLDVSELSSELNLDYEVVDRLSPREVDILLADTVGDLEASLSQIAQQLGITDNGLKDQRLKIYRKLGVINRAQASVFVLAFVNKARRDQRYPVVNTLENGRQFKEYMTPEARIDIQYVIEELDRTGLTVTDKQAFLAHYLWVSGPASASQLINKYLHISDKKTIDSMLDRVSQGESDPWYTMPLYEIYQRFFAPIEMSRAIFYGQKGDKTLEKFRALVAVSRRRIPLRRIERAETVAKTAVNKEAQRIVDQRRPSSEEIVVFG